MPRKILIVEDGELVLTAYRASLADAPLEILTATTLLEALEVFEANPDVELIAVDGLFPHDAGGSDVPDEGMPCCGKKFIMNIDFAGPIVACSSEPPLNRQLLAAGATHASTKQDLCKLIRELLSLPPVKD